MTRLSGLRTDLSAHQRLSERVHRMLKVALQHQFEKLLITRPFDIDAHIGLAAAFGVKVEANLQVSTNDLRLCLDPRFIPMIRCHAAPIHGNRHRYPRLRDAKTAAAIE